MDDNFDWLNRQLAAFVGELLHYRGFGLPLDFVVVGLDGAVLVGTYDAARSAKPWWAPIVAKPRFVAVHATAPRWTSDDLRLTARMIFVDRTRDASATFLLVGPPAAVPRWALARSLRLGRRPKPTSAARLRC